MPSASSIDAQLQPVGLTGEQHLAQLLVGQVVDLALDRRAALPDVLQGGVAAVDGVEAVPRRGRRTGNEGRTTDEVVISPSGHGRPVQKHQRHTSSLHTVYTLRPVGTIRRP